MTPFSKGKELLADVVSYAETAHVVLPKTQYAQIGNNTIACAGVYVTALGTDRQTLENSTAVNFGSELQLQVCGVVQLATYNIVIARDCANIANQDGTDDPVRVAALSDELDLDGELLWNFAEQYEAWNTKTYSMRWEIEGNLAYTSLSMTIGVD